MKTERICVVKRQRKEYLYIEGDRMLARLFVPILARFCVWIQEFSFIQSFIVKRYIDIERERNKKKRRRMFILNKDKIKHIKP